MSFIKSNFKIFYFYFLSLAGVFSFVTILPALLKSSFDLPTSSLSFGTTLFIFSFTVGSVFFTNYVDKKIDIVSMTIRLFIVDIISMIIMVLIFSGFITDKEVIIQLFYISRVVNGICAGGIATMTGYILKLKLLKSQNKEKTNSFIDSSFNIIKFIMPITGALLSESISLEMPMYLGMVLVMLSLHSIIKHKNTLHFHYTINIHKNKKNNKSNILLGLVAFFNNTRYLPVRLIFITTSFTRNITKPFFEFFMPVYLVSEFGFKVSEVAFVSGWLIIGIVLQPLTISFINKWSTSFYLLVSNVLLGFSVLVLTNYSDIYTSMYMLSFIMLIQGFSIGMFNNWKYKLINRISNDGIKVSHVSLINNLIGESSVYITLLVITFLIDLDGGVLMFFDFIYVALVLLILLSFFEVLIDRYYMKR